MMQFYFLSVISSLIVGLLLAFDSKLNQISFINNKTVRIAIGAVTFCIGLFQLFNTSDVFFFHDLIPAVCELAGGFTLMVEYYVSKSTVPLKPESFIQKIFVDKKNIIGYVCLAGALLHFLFPKVLFL